MMRRLITCSVCVTGLCFLALGSVERDPSLIYNPSSSAAVGWYQVTNSNEYLVGDLVAAWLPDRAEKFAHRRGFLPAKTPVIKTIAAIAGDEYCIEPGALQIEDQRERTIHSTDSLGREMPVLAGGCRRLNHGEFLIVSDLNDRSFDSRYFGPVRQSQIIGKVDFIGRVEGFLERDSREEGGARGMGAQGKIKGHGTNGPLSHCLHIDFYGTIGKIIVLENGLICNEYGVMQGYQFPIDPNRSRGPKR